MNSEEKRLKFLKQISVELRTQLNVISGVSSLWKSEIYDIDNVKEGFLKVEECSNTLLNIVNDIVDYSAVEMNEIEINNAEMNINDMVLNLVDKLYCKASQEKKQLDVQISNVSEEIVVGDEYRVEQIIACIIRKTTAYTKSGERITFFIDQTEENDKLCMHFVVRTSGDNFFAQLCETINNKVVTDTTDFELYNCYHILQYIGGDIDIVKNEAGESELCVKLLFDKSPYQKEEIKADYSQIKLLIIARDEEFFKERADLLEELNISYDTVTQVEEALDKIGEAESNNSPYNVCLVDWDIDKKMIKELVSGIHTIFGKYMLLAATAFDSDNQIKAAKNMSFDYVMPKTWFASTVQKALSDISSGNVSNDSLKITAVKNYDFTGKRILIAEDTALNMEIIVKILSKVNAEVTCACDGLEAVNIFESKPAGYFDCILMDVNMPVLDGYKAASRIRNSSSEDGRTIPIYAMTANVFQTDVKEAMNAGMDGHFSKPVDVEILYSTLQRLFGENNKNMKTQLVDYQVEETDELTGVLNKRSFEKKLIELAAYKKPVAYMTIDIDMFRDVNDSFGRVIGDNILKKVAECLLKKFRTSDYIMRDDNDEFVVLLKDFSRNSEFIEKKISEINDLLLKPEDGLPPVSISVGVSFSDYGFSEDMKEKSELALYDAKNSGKCGSIVLADDVSISEILWHKSFYGTGVFFLENDNGALLEKKDEYLELILGNNQAVGIICGFYDEGMPIYSMSGFALKNLGYDYDEFMTLTGGKFEKVIFPDDYECFNKSINEKQVSSRKIRLVHKNGDVLWFNETHINSSMTDGRKVWITSLRPVDDSMVGALCNMDYEIISLIYCNEDMILIEKGNEKITARELKKRKKYNYTSLNEEVFKYMVKESDREQFVSRTSIDNLKHMLKTRGMYEFICYQVNADKTIAAVRYKYRYFDAQQDIILCTQEYVHRWAESDDITELMNSSGFDRRAAEILSEDKDTKDYAILYFDIKDFKGWNELLGHTKANIILKNVADNLIKSKLSPAVAARATADHFMLLVESVNIDKTELSNLCNKQMVIDGNTVALRMHCGIYEITDRNLDINSMCDRARLAQKHIENEYAAPYYTYDRQLEEVYKNQLYVFNNLERAFLHDEFKVYYQPIFDTKTKKIASAEALVRWIRPGGKVIPPNMFIPVMEEKGHISKLDMVMIKGVEAFLTGREKISDKYVPVSINLSRMDFLNADFMQELNDNIKLTTVNHDYLRFEVTESAYVGVGQNGNTLLKSIRNKGSMIYIDDFGTGFSSLENLLEMEFDVIKLDMVFIRKIGISKASEEIIKSVVTSCHEMGKKVIAEGVETEEQYKFILESGCDYIQGFYFSKPLSQNEFAMLLDERL